MNNGWVELTIQKWKQRGNVNNILDLSNFNLTILPELPTNVRFLDCSNNKLTSLVCPIDLKWLDCSVNTLKEINLSKDLQVLFCSCNKLTNIQLPQSITHINCSNNYFKSLPYLPVTLYSVNCYNNPFLYNRINIYNKDPTNFIFDYTYSFSNYKILLKLQKKRRNKTRKKINVILLKNKIMYNNLIYDILKYF